MCRMTPTDTHCTPKYVCMYVYTHVCMQGGMKIVTVALVLAPTHVHSVEGLEVRL